LPSPFQRTGLAKGGAIRRAETRCRPLHRSETDGKENLFTGD
jgi:hypothetical protein